MLRQDITCSINRKGKHPSFKFQDEYLKSVQHHQQQNFEGKNLKKYFEFLNHFVFVAYPYAKVGFNATG